MDLLEADLELQAALYMLKQIVDSSECQDAEFGYIEKHSPQVFVCMKSIIRCKRKLKRSVLKSDKDLLDNAKKRMQKYILTVDIDEQIRILKYVQP